VFLDEIVELMYQNDQKHTKSTPGNRKDNSFTQKATRIYIVNVGLLSDLGPNNLQQFVYKAIVRKRVYMFHVRNVLVIKELNFYQKDIGRFLMCLNYVKLVPFKTLILKLHLMQGFILL
jgi:hypothetical protein